MPGSYRRLELGPEEATYGQKQVWEWPVRVAHWSNALSIVTLFATGIYIGTPQLSTAGEPVRHFFMGRVREVHFLAGYTLLFGFLLRSYWFWVGNNYSRSGFPFVWRPAWWQDLREQTMQYLSLERGHVHLGHNAMAGVAYTVFVIGLGWFQIVTGMALYSEGHRGGFLDHLVGWVIPFMGGSFQVRQWHHMVAWSFVIFIILHLYIVMFDSRQFRNGLISSIISGHKFYEKGDLDHDKWLS